MPSTSTGTSTVTSTTTTTSAKGTLRRARRGPTTPMDRPRRYDDVVIHPSAVVDALASIGARTRVWHFSHVMAGAVIGEDCVIGQGCFVASTARVGRGVKLQNNVSDVDGVVLEDDVFCGPSAVFT